MNVGQECWIVAAGAPKESTTLERDALLASLRNYSGSLRGTDSSGTLAPPWKFDVPDGERSLIFGSFDNLIKLTDDLQKADSQVDSLVHRLERQFLEIEPRAEFKVKTQRQEKTFGEYLRTWQWDEAKYPKTRPIVDNLALLMSVISKLDEEVRNKTAQYNDFKTARGNLAQKEGVNLANRDLVDVFVPSIVQMRGGADDDFIYEEHLTTLCVVCPRGTERDFLKSYEYFAEYVVPASARMFKGISDKEGNTMWRVVMFRSVEEEFKKKCREKRFVPRNFAYSEEVYKKLIQQRSQLEEACRRQHEVARGLYAAAWSDCVVAWLHIKAMRVFVESVLRFGMPPKFAAFIVCPKPGAQQAARKVLERVLGGGEGGPFAVGTKGADADDVEEYFPYVSLTFTPFNCSRAV